MKEKKKKKKKKCCTLNNQATSSSFNMLFESDEVFRLNAFTSKHMRVKDVARSSMHYHISMMEVETLNSNGRQLFYICQWQR